MFLFLKAPAEHVGHALQHTDVEVADMKVATNWQAESVKEMAQGIIDNFYLLGKKREIPLFVYTEERGTHLGTR